MLASQRLTIEQSEVRQRINDALGRDELTTEERSALETDTKRMSAIGVELRAALTVEGDEEHKAAASEPDAEMRERRELRSKASLGSFLIAAMQGREVRGAEAELQAAAGIDDGRAIPLELWDTGETEKREGEAEHRVVTGTPGTVGVNLDRIRPAVFATSVLPRLGVEMPRVDSGTYASATINASLTAGSQAKGGAQVATAATFNVTTATPKRISARLSIAIEDVAAVGQANFESILRENLALVLSDELDDQGLNGAAGNSGADLTGLFARLTAQTAAPSAVADFDAFAGAFADPIDGLWANMLNDVMIVCGPATYSLASKTFQSATNYKGEMSAAAYAQMNTGGLWTNKRMPDADTFISVTNVQQAIAYRMGRSMMGGMPGMRTAVCPHWNYIGIDDIYTDSASGQRHFTVHVLLGDVIVVQPDAYMQTAFKVA